MMLVLVTASKLNNESVYLGLPDVARIQLCCSSWQQQRTSLVCYIIYSILRTKLSTQLKKSQDG